MKPEVITSSKISQAQKTNTTFSLICRTYVCVYIIILVLIGVHVYTHTCVYKNDNEEDRQRSKPKGLEEPLSITGKERHSNHGSYAEGRLNYRHTNMCME